MADPTPDDSRSSDELLTAALPSPVLPAVQDKLRIRFAKTGDLRFLSHHDLMRCFERLLRRAELPVHQTRGFHPHLRLVFALSLPLGVVGREEIAEVELDQRVDPQQALAALSRQAPSGLQILSVQRVPPGSSVTVRALCYRLPLPADRVEPLRARLAEVLSASTLWAARNRPRKDQTPLAAAREEPDDCSPARDLRPFLRDLRIVQGDGSALWYLEMDLWMTLSGTARPVEMLGLLGLLDLLEAGVVLERTRLELHE